MNSVDKQYLELLRYILKNGTLKSDRTGTGTISVFDYTMRFNMSEGFPLLTSKKMFTKGVIHEMIWFLQGNTNIKYLLDNDVHIWDGDCYKKYIKETDKLDLTKKENSHLMMVTGTISNARARQFTKEEFINKIKTDDKFSEEWGDLGPIYGNQWRYWSHMSVKEKRSQAIGLEGCANDSIDQIEVLINDLKNNPDSRRLMVTAWNPADLEEMTLPPCHYGFQCYTTIINVFERKRIWCDSINKHISYAEDIDEVELDTLGVPKRKLSLKWTQRSCDVPLGTPFNIASYGLLLHLLAKEVNMIPHELIFSGGDCHIYLDQIDGVKKQLQQESFDLPKLNLTNVSINTLSYDDIKIIGYKSSPSVNFPLSN